MTEAVRTRKCANTTRRIADIKHAIAMNPKYARGYQSLGWLQATCPDAGYRDGNAAVRNANMGFQLDDRKFWPCLETIAAAYAESGDFERAKEWQAKAVETAASDKSAKENTKLEIHARLELYKQGKPYREQPKR